MHPSTTLNRMEELDWLIALGFGDMPQGLIPNDWWDRYVYCPHCRCMMKWSGYSKVGSRVRECPQCRKSVSVKARLPHTYIRAAQARVLLQAYLDAVPVKTAANRYRVSREAVRRSYAVFRGVYGAVVCPCGRPMEHSGPCTWRGVGCWKKNVTTLRRMYLAGISRNEAVRQTNIGRRTVDHYYRQFERQFGVVPCGCGEPATHTGWCQWRRRLRGNLGGGNEANDVLH
jgi:hypothetical protein